MAATNPGTPRGAATPGRRAAPLLIVGALLLPLFAAAPAAAQDHRFRLFAGVGVQLFARPDLKLGRGIGLGGAAAVRLNDRWSIESAFHFGRSNRRYTAEDQPVEDVVAEPAYQFRTNRYHLDGSLVHHFGRRQPFHTWILAGAGIVRRDEFQEDFIYAEPDEDSGTLTGLRFPIGNEVSLETTEYAVTMHIGAGFEVYVFDYLSAAAEYRIWIPSNFGLRTQQIVVGVNYYR